MNEEPDKTLQTTAIVGGGLGILTIGLGVLVAVVIFAAVAATASALLGIFSLGGGENQTSSITTTGIAPPLIKDRLAAADCLSRWMKQRQPSSPLVPLGLRMIDAALNQDMPYNPALIPAIADAESSLATNGRLVTDKDGINPHNPFGVTGGSGSRTIKVQKWNFMVFNNYEESIDYIGPYLPRKYFKQNVTTLEDLRTKYCGDPALNSSCLPWLSTVSKDLNGISAACPDFAQEALSSGYLSGKLSPPVDPFPPNSPTTYLNHSTYRTTTGTSANPRTKKVPATELYAGDIWGKVDTPVRAISEGTVTYKGPHIQKLSGKCQGKYAGDDFEFLSADGQTYAFYAHVARYGPTNGLGQNNTLAVHRGEAFAAIANRCGTAHLHLEMQIDDQPIPCSRFDELFGLPKRGCRNQKKGVTYT